VLGRVLAQLGDPRGDHEKIGTDEILPWELRAIFLNLVAELFEQCRRLLESTPAVLMGRSSEQGFAREGHTERSGISPDLFEPGTFGRRHRVGLARDPAGFEVEKQG